MSDTVIPQWKYVVGYALQKSAYILGAAALVGALVVSHLVKLHVVPLVDDDLAQVVAFTASFFAYLAIVGTAGMVGHFGLWRLGARLTTPQPQEFTWKTKRSVEPPLT